MDCLGLSLSAAGMMALSGVPALFGRRGASLGQRLAAVLMVLGGALGLTAVAMVAGGAQPAQWVAAWPLPVGRFEVALDGVSAVFLAPVFLVPALGAIYGLDYWPQQEHTHNGRRLTFFYGLLAASMVMVVLARDAVLFLIAWEAMALAAFFAATTEDNDPAVCRAGWVYLIATHVGTLCLIAMFALWRRETGAWALAPLPAAAPAPALASAIFVLGLIGFGVKAGIMPVHVWLPGAHASAPSHVSAVMSGVMLKMGLYGLVRLTALLPPAPPWWGGLLLGLGAATGILGIAFALGQQDLKRLLAYSSIENIGIILLGLGLAVLGRALGHTSWVIVGLAGALLHVWNHSLFKSLLFFNAGAVIHAVHTREIDRLGGLARRMPATAALFLLGAVAICALPPLNGFAGEFLIYLGLFRTAVHGAGPAWPAAALGAAALSLIGALAAACFVRLAGAVFLGQGRSDATAHAHDPARGMLLPMAVLGGACLALGVLPGQAAPLLALAAANWMGAPGAVAAVLPELAPLRLVGALSGALLAALALAWLGVRALMRARRPGRTGTWDCGYALPSARMQYTASSFGRTLVDLFGWALWPRRQSPRIVTAFAEPTLFACVVPDTVLDRVVLPVFRFADRHLPWLRLLQQGRLHLYLIYILGTVLILLWWGKTGAQP